MCLKIRFITVKDLKKNKTDKLIKSNPFNKREKRSFERLMQSNAIDC